MGRRAVLSLGSNVGDSLGHLQAACAGLAAHPDVLVNRVSSVYATAPVGGVEQDDFLNIAVDVSTTLAPHDLLAVCQKLEQERDRVRLVRWGPRTLDVDIVWIDGVESSDPQLTVPHPRAHERAFVLVPWAEIAAHDVLIDPAGQAIAVADRARACADRRNVRAVDEWSAEC